MVKYMYAGWQMTFNRRANKDQGEEPLARYPGLVIHLLKLCRLHNLKRIICGCR